MNCRLSVVGLITHIVCSFEVCSSDYFFTATNAVITIIFLCEPQNSISTAKLDEND